MKDSERKAWTDFVREREQTPKGKKRERRSEPMQDLFHVTTADRAAAILRHGFRDITGTYLTDQEFSGVWLSDQPLDVNEGAEGDAVLRVTFSIPLTRLDEFEWVEEGKGYREWLVPAEFINKHATVAFLRPQPTNLSFSVRRSKTAKKRW